MKKLLSALYAMPGPVWLFGAFGVSRMWSWLLAWAASGSLPTTWTAAAFDLCTLLASLLPLTLLWLLLRRSPYAVQQVSLRADGHVGVGVNGLDKRFQLDSLEAVDHDIEHCFRGV